MGSIIGRGRYARATYPVASFAAVRHLISITNLPAPFTPAAAPAFTLVGACLVTPIKSGLFFFSATGQVTNGAAAGTYTLAAIASIGASLSVSGGSVSRDGWTLGTTTPPIVGGSGIVPIASLAEATEAIAANGNGAIVCTGTNDSASALPLNVPSVVMLSILQPGGGVSAINFFDLQASIIEL